MSIVNHESSFTWQFGIPGPGFRLNRNPNSTIREFADVIRDCDSAQSNRGFRLVTSDWQSRFTIV